MPDSLRSRRIVAESLDVLGVLPDGIDEWLIPPAALIAAIPPIALRASQQEPWHRVMRALDGWRAAVLAEPVGSGKTWISLAVAIARRKPIAVIAPAMLRDQWHRTARRIGCQISFTSLEQTSRGVLPPAHAGVVLIDEAHRLRHSNTRRVDYLAPWLPGREVVLITGTPIVGAPRDLLRILRLVLADDALRLDGIVSLDALIEHAGPPIGLRRLVVRSAPPRGKTRVVHLPVAAGPLECARGRRVIAALARLRLGETNAIARLVRGVLLDAATSSDRAWRSALKRYATLLHHARDAGALSRHDIRRFVGCLPDQGVLWQMIRDSPSTTALPLEDLDRLADLLAAPPADDGWLADLGAATDDDIPTLWFTRHLATATLLREQLGPGSAWITGQAAGIGHTRLPRSTVLAAFGPSRAAWHTMHHVPRDLILTDVGAEGLDLQGAGRVVHVDLPWHDVGMRQRLGRIVRSGQPRPVVTEVVRIPAPTLARALGITRIIRTKRVQAERWLGTLDGSRPGHDQSATTRAPVETADESILVQCRLGAREGLLAFESLGDKWRQVDPARITTIRDSDLFAPLSEAHPLPAELVDLVSRATAPASVVRPELVTRLSALARAAARARQPEEIRRLDEALSVVIRSHPIGIERRLDAMERSDRIEWDLLLALRPFDQSATIVAWARIIGSGGWFG